MGRGEQLIRQWNLLKALQSVYYGLSADELAQRLECSKRQILRDLNVLQQVGFPVSYQQRDYGKRYWKLTAHFLESDKLVFSLTELISLYVSQKLLSPLAGTPFGQGIQTLMDKIKALVNPKALRYFQQLDQMFLVKMAYAASPIDHKIVNLLVRSVENQSGLLITYRSLSTDQPYQTVYHPYGLIFFDNDLYCIGWMQRYGQVRTIKVSRILSAKPVDQPFDKPQGFSIQNYIQNSLGIFSEDQQKQTYRLEFSDWAAVYVRESRRHPSQKILVDDGKTIQVELTLSSTTELKRWLLSFGRYARALWPPEFVQQMAVEVENMRRLYPSDSKSQNKF